MATRRDVMAICRALDDCEEGEIELILSAYADVLDEAGEDADYARWLRLLPGHYKPHGEPGAPLFAWERKVDGWVPGEAGQLPAIVFDHLPQVAEGGQRERATYGSRIGAYLDLADAYIAMERQGGAELNAGW